MPEFDFNDFADKISNTIDYPSVYMFKFIVKSDNRTIALVENIFDADAQLSQKSSSGGKYTGITVRQVVTSKDDIISVYKKANEIEGVIWL
ncbi:MAG: DUF493 domain-containing protein [Bacteroidota bacterium]|jgi:putative lipoic acid-binding regulatory protein